MLNVLHFMHIFYHHVSNLELLILQAVYLLIQNSRRETRGLLYDDLLEFPLPDDATTGTCAFLILRTEKKRKNVQGEQSKPCRIDLILNRVAVKEILRHFSQFICSLKINVTFNLTTTCYVYMYIHFE